MIDIEVKVKKNKDVLGRLLKLKDGYVKVGWYEGQKEPNGLLVAENAYLQEHGFNIKHKNGKTTHVPARPFLTITMDKRENKWSRLWKLLVKKYIDGKQTLIGTLDSIGSMIRDDIQLTIASNVPPPNAKSTIEAKKRKGGSLGTLRDSETMFKSINFNSFEGKEK